MRSMRPNRPCTRSAPAPGEAMAVEPAIAELIREVLAEELAHLKRGPREEWVRIAGDADLAEFVKRVLAMGGDPGARAAFDGGRLVFRLDGGAGPGGANDGRERSARGGEGRGRTGREGGVETLDGGLLSERRVARLPRGTGRLRVGHDVRITPLARDRLRRLGITIERTEK